MTVFLTDDDCSRLLTMEGVIGCVESAFALAGGGEVQNPPRFRMPTPEGPEFQFGVARLPSRNIAGFKVGSPQTQRWIFLYAVEPSRLLAVLQARTISRLRTGATSAVAAKYLSPPDAHILGIYGTGRQAEAQIEAICCVRRISEIHAFSRDETKRLAFCRKISERLGIPVSPVAAPELLPRTGAHIIVTITNSTTPVLLGEWVDRPCLVLCAGANHVYEREIDDALVEKARLIVVDDYETSRAESGDLLHPAAQGRLAWKKVRELGDFVSGRLAPADAGAGIIVFESHGLAMQDVASAALAYELAMQQQIGSPLPF